MNEFEWGYCIGLIAGEGCFQVKADGRAAHLEVKMHADDPEPLEFLHRCLGGKLYGPYESQGRRFRIWRLNGEALVEALGVMIERMPESRKRGQMQVFYQAHWCQRPASLKHGKRHTGEDNAQSKLTEADVRLIRGSGEMTHILAARYGVSCGTIYRARTGRAWAALEVR